MKPDVKIEIIYYGAAADWSFESGFYGKEYALRLLTQTAANPSAFLKALDRAVRRSAVILTVGDLANGDRTGLCSLLARALGMDYPPEGGLPGEARPFDSADPRRGGYMESGPQTIFLLHNQKDRRDETLRRYIFPALSRRFSVPIGGCAAETPGSAAAAASVPDEPVPAGESAGETIQPAPSSVSPPESPPASPAAVTPVAVSTAAAVTGRRKLSVRMKRTQAPALAPAAAPPYSSDSDEAPTAVAAHTPTPAASVSAAALSALPTPSPIPAGPALTPEPIPAHPEPDPSAPFQPASAADEEGQSETALAQGARPVPESPAQPGAPAPQADQAVFFGFDAYESAGRKKGKRVWAILLITLLILAVTAGGCFGWVKWFQPWQADRVYARMSGLYGQDGEGGLPPSALPKFGGLYDVNSDVAGWLTLPNTAVDYPVMAVNSRTAAYYESHLPDGAWNRMGSLYTGCIPYPDSYYRNITVYGKDTGDGRMLSDLRRYLELDFYKSSPLITMDTLYTKGQWKIFSVFETSGEDPLDYNQSAFSDDTAFLTYIAALSDRSAVRTMVDLRADDEILTLVAKGGQGGVVLAARRVRAGESTQVDVAGAVENPNPQPVTQAVLPASDSLLLRFGLLQAAAAEAPAQSTEETSSDPGAAALDSLSAGHTDPASSAPSAGQPADTQPNASADRQEPGQGLEEGTGGPPAVPSYPAVSPPSGGELTLTVRNQHDGDKLVTASASEIVAGVVEAEMGGGYQLEALKAQSVAAYSWLLCNGAADGKNPRVYLKTPSAKTLQAVAATKGERALYNGSVACTFYYDTSAGRTALPSDIWEGGDQPYLVSVESPLDQNNPRFQTTVTYRAADVAVWIKEAYGLEVNSANKQNWFQVTYDDYGLYARRVLLDGTVWIRGPSLRGTLFTAARVGSGNGLRSSAYTIAYDAGSDTFTFTVKGYGHGVGMSQTGANEYAKQGWDYRQILQHYFTGVTIG